MQFCSVHCCNCCQFKHEKPQAKGQSNRRKQTFFLSCALSARHAHVKGAGQNANMVNKKLKFHLKRMFRVCQGLRGREH